MTLKRKLKKLLEKSYALSLDFKAKLKTFKLFINYKIYKKKSY